MDLDFRDKVILVTGASGGIGGAIAREFASHGGRVALHYGSNRATAEEVMRSLDGDGHFVAQADITEPREAQRLVDEVVSRGGQLDVLVNNAGIWRQHPVADVGYEEWQRAWSQTLAINLLAPAYLVFCAARHMISRGGGRIVNVSSRGAFRGEPTAPAYGASKAGLNAMGQSLAVALAPHGIFIGTVAPGFVETEMARDSLAGASGEAIRSQSPLNRVARPEEIAYVVAFLASDGAEFTTGTVVDVNGASYLRT